MNKYWSKRLTSLIFESSDYEEAKEFAKWQFKLNSESGSKGETLKSQLEVVWKTTGVKPPELEPPCELNQLFYDAWRFFLDLHSSRSSNGFGVNALTFTEIKAYFELNQIEPFWYEIEAIKMFDSVFLDEFAKSQEKQRKQQESKTKVNKK